MMTTDRVGGIIYNGIEGETVSYNGKSDIYTAIEAGEYDYSTFNNVCSNAKVYQIII